MALSVALVVAYVVVLTFVAIRARAAREYAEFSLAKRALPLALVFGSLCATYVGPGFSIGFVGKGLQSGLLFLLVGLAYSVQNVLVGVFIAPRLRSLSDCHTLGDAIGQKYNVTCQILAGVISVGLCAGFAAVMAKAGGVVVKDIFGIPRWASISLMVLVTALYTTSGGLRASVMTDAFQFASFTLLLPAIFVFAVFRHAGGGAALVHEMTVATSTGLRSTHTMEIIGLVAAFFLGETLIPPYANRALASETTRVSRNSFILAGVFSLLWFTVMISLGIVARPIIGENVEEDYVLLTLVREILPVEGYALLLVALVSVIMSSLDSLLNAGAVAFTEDVVKPFAAVSDKTSLALGRYATVAIAVLAGAAAVAVPSIISGLLICYTVWAPAILPAMVLGLWLRKPRPLAGILSMLTGASMALLFQFIWSDGIRSPAIIPALGAALLAYLVGHVFGRPTSENT